VLITGWSREVFFFFSLQKFKCHLQGLDMRAEEGFFQFVMELFDEPLQKGLRQIDLKQGSPTFSLGGGRGLFLMEYDVRRYTSGANSGLIVCMYVG
jgi:hypothetical protein